MKFEGFFLVIIELFMGFQGISRNFRGFHGRFIRVSERSKGNLEMSEVL